VHQHRPPPVAKCPPRPGLPPGVDIDATRDSIVADLNNSIFKVTDWLGAEELRFQRRCDLIQGPLVAQIEELEAKLDECQQQENDLKRKCDQQGDELAELRPAKRQAVKLEEEVQRLEREKRAVQEELDKERRVSRGYKTRLDKSNK
jgi:chromosome segregation ATPase